MALSFDFLSGSGKLSIEKPPIIEEYARHQYYTNIFDAIKRYQGSNDKLSIVPFLEEMPKNLPVLYCKHIKGFLQDTKKIILSKNDAQYLSTIEELIAIYGIMENIAEREEVEKIYKKYGTILMADQIDMPFGGSLGRNANEMPYELRAIEGAEAKWPIIQEYIANHVGRIFTVYTNPENNQKSITYLGRALFGRVLKVENF